jgi:phosphoenolpyruvate carboxykinase (GTP)
MVKASVVEAKVEEAARLCRPDHVVWCDGSPDEHAGLIEGMLRDGTLLPLNPATHPDSYLHRSHPQDVARTEHLTYVCTAREEDAGPNNNWMLPSQAKDRVSVLFRGAMKDRTMYVVPYLMGPETSPYARTGVMVTDSAYVAASMQVMTLVGDAAFEHMRTPDDFVFGLHSLGDLSPDRRFILHFPEERLIWSVGSGYGGNALLAKKCHALRIASCQARQEGWLAEHMLILGLEEPSGEVTYLAAAMPSATGKTNLSMLVSSLPGYRVWTVGDDIAWIHIGDGRLHAINPERGAFGVAPNTGPKTNPSALQMISKETIFTNVAVTPQGDPWWEGLTDAPPAGLADWRGRNWVPADGPAAHPNSRFTAYLRNCPTMSAHWQDPEGVPISGFIFGGRRTRVVPLVFEAFNWRNGVYLGASMGSETTAAATGQVGIVRRDPMAMLPFCGYNMGDYFAYWLDLERRVPKLPKIFRINWFRRGEDGRFLWPGFGENVRVLKWIVDRIHGRAEAVETPIGWVPEPEHLDLNGLRAPRRDVEEALSLEREGWLLGLEEQHALFERYGDRVPAAIWQEHRDMLRRLKGRTA